MLFPGTQFVLFYYVSLRKLMQLGTSDLVCLNTRDLERQKHRHHLSQTQVRTHLLGKYFYYGAENWDLGDMAAGLGHSREAGLQGPDTQRP